MTLAPRLNILVIEDDPRMLELLCRGLHEVGHTATPAADGDSGLDLAIRYSFDVILLDLGLPGRDGLDIALALRAQNSNAFILMVTARDAEDDVVRGLDSGADHYLVKPFSFPELLARIHGLARSPRRPAPSALLLDPVRLTVRRDNALIQLTRTEYILLAALNRQAGAPVSRQSLLESIWGAAPIGPSALDVLVNSLRAKFDGPYSVKRIITVRGTGYSLQSEAAARQNHLHSSDIHQHKEQSR